MSEEKTPVPSGAETEDKVTSNEAESEKTLPIEIVYDSVKHNIIQYANQLATDNNIPAFLIILIMKEIVSESTIANYTDYINGV